MLQERSGMKEENMLNIPEFNKNKQIWTNEEEAGGGRLVDGAQQSDIR